MSIAFRKVRILPEMPSTSAFVQQRYKIKPEDFKAVFDGFTSRLINNTSTELRIFAIDGSDIQIATNPDDTTSYIIPIRPDRHRERKLTAKTFHGFLYRVA